MSKFPGAAFDRWLDPPDGDPRYEGALEEAAEELGPDASDEEVEKLARQIMDAACEPDLIDDPEDH
jgi:hypothetical protein